jgi:hypothetical protein
MGTRHLRKEVQRLTEDRRVYKHDVSSITFEHPFTRLSNSWFSIPALLSQMMPCIGREPVDSNESK